MRKLGLNLVFLVGCWGICLGMEAAPEIRKPEDIVSNVSKLAPEVLEAALRKYPEGVNATITEFWGAHRSGVTALHEATSWFQYRRIAEYDRMVKNIKILLRLGAEPLAEDSTHATPWMRALEYAHPGVVKAFLEYDRALAVTIKDYYRAIATICECWNFRDIIEIVRLGVPVAEIVNCAVRDSRVHVLTVLLSEGLLSSTMEVNPSGVAITGDTVLHFAIRQAGYPVWKAFVRQLIIGTVDTPNKEGATPLFVAVDTINDPDPDIVGWLLAVGANPNAPCKSRETPFLRAVARKKIPLINKFFEQVPIVVDFNVKGQAGNNVLHVVAATGDLDLIRLVERHIPASPALPFYWEAVNDGGNMPLHEAVGAADNVLEYLVTRFTPAVSHRNNVGESPLDIMIKHILWIARLERDDSGIPGIIDFATFEKRANIFLTHVNRAVRQELLDHSLNKVVQSMADFHASGALDDSPALTHYLEMASYLQNGLGAREGGIILAKLKERDPNNKYQGAYLLMNLAIAHTTNTGPKLASTSRAQAISVYAQNLIRKVIALGVINRDDKEYISGRARDGGNFQNYGIGHLGRLPIDIRALLQRNGIEIGVLSISLPHISSPLPAFATRVHLSKLEALQESLQALQGKLGELSEKLVRLKGRVAHSIRR